MTLELAQKLRRSLGWLGTLAAVLLLGAMVDIVVVRQRTPFNVLQVLPGQEEAIDGPLAEKTRVNDLEYTSDSPDLEVVFDETFTGFWLGGEKWRGRLRVKPTAKPGKYLVTIQPRQPFSEGAAAAISGLYSSGCQLLAAEFAVFLSAISGAGSRLAGRDEPKSLAWNRAPDLLAFRSD